ncbi:MFS transporter [Arthrobacter sp. NPDC056691]|uniref:MFS transporter n=1 Tax=Arthrobacter sp. NPDC056691 TaxID=3345913 RepID=UPI00366E6164
MTSLHAVGILLATPVTTRFTPRTGPRKPLVAGLSLMTAGVGALALTGHATPGWLTGAATLVTGAGFGTTIVPLQTATVSGLHGPELADGSTIVNMARQIGMAGSALPPLLLLPSLPGAAPMPPVPDMPAPFSSRVPGSPGHCPQSRLQGLEARSARSRTCPETARWCGRHESIMKDWGDGGISNI